VHDHRLVTGFQQRQWTIRMRDSVYTGQGRYGRGFYFIKIDQIGAGLDQMIEASKPDNTDSEFRKIVDRGGQRWSLPSNPTMKSLSNINRISAPE
jgi:hypothetical protein